MFVPGQGYNTHLNPHAPVFKPTTKEHSRVETQIERLTQKERNQPPDGKDTTQDRSEGEEAKLQEEDMQEQEIIQSQDSDSEVQEPEHQEYEDDAVSSEDDHEHQTARRSTRTHQPKCIFTYDALGKPSNTPLRK